MRVPNLACILQVRCNRHTQTEKSSLVTVLIKLSDLRKWTRPSPSINFFNPAFILLRTARGRGRRPGNEVNSCSYCSISYTHHYFLMHWSTVILRHKQMSDSLAVVRQIYVYGLLLKNGKRLRAKFHTLVDDPLSSGSFTDRFFEN